MRVNKDTKIYGSFSSNPGNLGCEFHNRGFKKLGINAIYKSFKVLNLLKGFEATRTLDIKGAGISMPFKQDVLKYADVIDHVVEEIGASNTVVQDAGIIHAYNTDWLAADEMLKDKEGSCFILGDGGCLQAAR
jgi:shikimate dehydrogenase